MTVAVFLGTLFGTMALGMPIAFALLLCAVALMIQQDLFDAQIVAQNIINGADSFPLMAVPFFMLAGEIMNEGGLSKRIVNLAMALVGHLRGGLGFVAIFAACVMASLSGSAVADAAALSALLLPMMVKAGHDRFRSGGLIASAAIIGPIIPPSIGFIIFGVASGLSITKLFLAGIFPGLLIGLALCIAWWWSARRENAELPPRRSGRERLRALVDSLWALLLPFIIILGLRFGVFTPTEAGVVAAVYSLFVATVVYRELSLKKLYAVLIAAATVTSIVMFLVAASLVAAWLITIADLPGQVAALLEPLMDSPTLLLAVIMLLVVAIGMAMDMTPAILILAPVLVPVVREAGIDPIYFGVLFIINLSIGLVTPPIGTVLNVVCGIAKLRMDEIVRGVWPFLLAELIVLFLLVLFPSLVTVPAAWLAG
jgi:tripartite ATP-independent transporter DctM subunit